MCTDRVESLDDSRTPYLSASIMLGLVMKMGVSITLMVYVTASQLQNIFV